MLLLLGLLYACSFCGFGHTCTVVTSTLKASAMALHCGHTVTATSKCIDVLAGLWQLPLDVTGVAMTPVAILLC